jgi:aerobic carbon-monoxide dehydrogenase medium subunit
MSDLEYIEPNSLEGVFALLDPDDPAVRPIGGGTALMLMMKAGMYKPRRLVSLRQIGNRFDSFAQTADGSAFRIGALTTFAQLEHSPEIRARFPVISQAMKTLANVRVRNVATVGGNIAHADPHLDLPPIWVALDATALIVKSGAERVIPVEEIFAGYYETTISNDELVAEIEVPIRPGWYSRYVKVTTRAAHDWPALGLALSLDFEDTRVRDLRLVLSAAIDRPVRLLQAEGALRGEQINDASLKRAVEACLGEVEIESDSRGSSDYKRHLLAVHLRRAIDAIAAENLG